MENLKGKKFRNRLLKGNLSNIIKAVHSWFHTCRINLQDITADKRHTHLCSLSLLISVFMVAHATLAKNAPSFIPSFPPLLVMSADWSLDFDEAVCVLCMTMVSALFFSGAQGEYAGLAAIKAYLNSKGESSRSVSVLERAKVTGLQSWLIILFYPTQNYFKLESLVSARKWNPFLI